jgi:hypothetical protein
MNLPQFSAMNSTIADGKVTATAHTGRIVVPVR